MYPTDSEGNIQGASTVLAPDKARLSGEYYKLPKETILPDGMPPLVKRLTICLTETEIIQEVGFRTINEEIIV